MSGGGSSARLTVNRIQRFSLHDGPGIRTTVFTQGCDLRCWWCHNPETQQRTAPEAQSFTPEALIETLERDARYWRASGGGVTFSGGEPLVQARALVPCLAMLGKRNRHRTIDTAGDVPLSHVQAVAPYADLWLWDLKLADAGAFAEHTGGRLERVVDNLRWLLGQTTTPVRIRIPVIADVNDSECQVRQLVQLIDDLPRRACVEPLMGHDMGRTDPTPSTKVSPARFRAIHAALTAADREAAHA